MISGNDDGFRPYSIVPRNMRENVRHRIWLLQWTNDEDGDRNADVRRRRREVVWRACSRDILFFVNTFGWLLEPRLMKKMPWLTYDFQDEAILKMQATIQSAIDGEPKDLIQSKSRDMGASWICVLVVLWFALFRPNFSALLLSYKAELVDSEDPKSLFFKLDYLLRHLPKWMVPNMKRKEMIWRNLDNDSFIKGDTTTEYSGIADRTTCAVLDEASLMDKLDSIWVGTQSVTDCRIANFTMRRYATYATALTKKAEYVQSRLYWTLHPLKVRGLYVGDPVSGVITVKDKRYVFKDGYKFIADGKERSPWADAFEKRCATPEEMDAEVYMLTAGSSLDVFDTRALQRQRDEVCRVATRVGDVIGDDRNVVWDEKDVLGRLSHWGFMIGSLRPPRADYVIGGDIAAGVGASNSVLSVWNRNTCEKVAEYSANTMDPVTLADKAVQLAWFFMDESSSPALLKWESNGGSGSMFTRRIIELRFSNVYFHRNEKSVSGKVSELPGWHSSPADKTALIRNYAIGLRNGSARNYSRRAIDECAEYTLNNAGIPTHVGSWKGGDSRDTEFNHGDHVIADSLAWSECRTRDREALDSSVFDEPKPQVMYGRAFRDKMREEARAATASSPWWKRGVYAKGQAS